MSDKILSCFIDESGDFGPYDYHAPLYIVSIILHDQQIDISEHIQAHEDRVARLGYPHHALHTGPLIRRESDYASDLMEHRKHLFNVLFSNVDIRRVKPADYKLFQIADLICTLELVNAKATSNSFSKSETEFLKSPKDFRKEYYRKIVKKHI